MLIPSGVMRETVRAPDLPADVRPLVDAVVSLGPPVYAVGGAVRDRLLGLEVDDFDFATASRPEQVGSALESLGLEVDVDRGLGRVAIVSGGGEVVFTTLRREGGYGADRRPRDVEFVEKVPDDALRRDFTINAIYQDVADGSVLDPCGGLVDLASRTLRVIGDPRVRLDEDPLRILRAIRFASSRGLRPSPATFAALAECAPRIAALSGSRRFEELEQMLSGRGAAAAIERILDLGMLGDLSPVLRGGEARVRREVLPFLDRVPAAGPAVEGALAVLFGEASTAEQGLLEFGAPRSVRHAVARVLGTRLDLMVGRSRVAKRRLLLESDAFARDVLRLWDEVAPAGPERVADLCADLDSVPELPMGADVLDLGVPPGPGVGEVLRSVREAVDQEGTDDPARIRDILVREAAAWIKRNGQAGR